MMCVCRYDHYSRLMPYLLTAHADPDGSGVSPPGKPPPQGTVVAESLAAMELLGKAYEDEYPNEVPVKKTAEFVAFRRISNVLAVLAC